MRDPGAHDRSTGGEEALERDPGRRMRERPKREMQAPEPLDEVVWSAAEYQALFEVARLVSSTLDLDRVLDLIVDRCRALMGVASAGIFKLDAAAGMLVYERGVGLSPEFVSALRVRVGEGTTGKAVQVVR